MPECTICGNPKAPEILLRVYNNELTLADAAKELNTSYSMLWHHVRFHEGKPTPEVTEKSDALEVLSDISTWLKDRLDQMKDLNVSPTNEKMITGTVDSLRQTLMDVERLTGRLRSAPLIQLQQVTINYEQLVGFLASEELCDECRAKVISFLKQKIASTAT